MMMNDDKAGYSCRTTTHLDVPVTVTNELPAHSLQHIRGQAMHHIAPSQDVTCTGRSAIVGKTNTGECLPASSEAIIVSIIWECSGATAPTLQWKAAPCACMQRDPCVKPTCHVHETATLTTTQHSAIAMNPLRWTMKLAATDVKLLQPRWR
jgi:hypothetical protein